MVNIFVLKARNLYKNTIILVKWQWLDWKFPKCLRYSKLSSQSLTTAYCLVCFFDSSGRRAQPWASQSSQQPLCFLCFLCFLNMPTMAPATAAAIRTINIIVGIFIGSSILLSAYSKNDKRYSVGNG